jgi:hypothetical protein
MVQLENVLEASINRISEQCVVILNTVTSSQVRADFQVPYQDSFGKVSRFCRTGGSKSVGFLNPLSSLACIIGRGTPMKIETLHPFRQVLRSSQSAVMMILSDIEEFDGGF